MSEKAKMVAPFQPTKEQRKWLDDKAKRNGSSMANIMRSLIQEKIDKGE